MYFKGPRCWFPYCRESLSSWSYRNRGKFTSLECFYSVRHGTAIPAIKVVGNVVEGHRFVFGAKHASHHVGRSPRELEHMAFWVDLALSRFAQQVSPGSYLGFEIRSHQIHIFLADKASEHAWVNGTAFGMPKPDFLSCRLMYSHPSQLFLW